MTPESLRLSTVTPTLIPEYLVENSSLEVKIRPTEIH